MRQRKSIRLELENSVAILVFDRQGRNFLDKDLLNEFLDVMCDIETGCKQGEIRALILTGNEYGFVPGLDLKELLKELDRGGSDYMNHLQNGRKAIRMIEALPVPALAAVNTFALGGGLEIALACDFIFADQSAILGFPEVRVGLIPGAGGTVLLRDRIGIVRARELIYTGKTVDSATALHWGLVDKVHQNEALLPEAKNWIATITANDPIVVGKAKQSIHTCSYDSEQELFDSLLIRPTTKVLIERMLKKS